MLQYNTKKRKAGECLVGVSDSSLADLARRLVTWLRDQVRSAGARGAVFGLSGGVDSSVVGALCRQAFGDDCLGLIMPCHSPSEDAADAQLVASTLGIPTRVVDLSPVYDAMLTAMGEPLASTSFPPPMNRINLKPRLRMATLYFYAANHNYLVVGAENRSELEIGYFTKYGDGGVDLLPLGRLLKTDVYELARYLGVPDKIIERVPSAGLWPGQTDEDELGFSYDVLDRYLATGEADDPIATRIERLRQQSAHKRRFPPLGPGRE